MAREMQPEISAEEVFQSRLKHGERILWAGRPEQRVVPNVLDYIVSAVFLLVGYRYIDAWVREVTFVLRDFNGPKNSSYILNLIILLPWVAGLFYLIFGRIIYKYWRNKRTFFALTDRRALSIRIGSRPTFRSAHITSLRKMPARRPSPETISGVAFGDPRGPGDIYFLMVMTGMDLFPLPIAIPDKSVLFYDIKDAPHIYDTAYSLLSEEAKAKVDSDEVDIDDPEPNQGM